MHVYNWMFVSFTKYLLHVSTLAAPSSGRTLITSQNHRLIVILLQYSSHRTWRIIICWFFRNLFSFIKLILSRIYGLTLWLNHCKNLRISGWFWEVISVLPEDSALSTTCWRYLMNSADIQLYLWIYLEN